MSIPTSTETAEMFIQFTDRFPPEELTPRIMELRQKAFQVLIDAGSK